MKIRQIIDQMTLEEKASLCSGSNGWESKGVERLQVPSVRVSDGPHGLRKQVEGTDNLGMMESIRAVCFPAGCALASSFDKNLLCKFPVIAKTVSHRTNNPSSKMEIISSRASV